MNLKLKLLSATITLTAFLTISANAHEADMLPPNIDDPVSLRINIMHNIGEAVAISAAMMKGEAPYDARVGLMALTAIYNGSLGINGLFPDGTDTHPASVAAPAIWTNSEGFEAAISKFINDAQAAVHSKPSDLEAFKLAFTSVASNCRSCHEDFKVRK